MRKLASMVLILAGVIFIGIAIFQEVSTIYNQRKLISEYSKYIDTLKNMEVSELEAEAAVSTDADLDTNLDAVAEVNVNEQITTEPNTEQTGESEQIINTGSETPETPKNTEPDLSKVFEGKQISGLIEIPKINVSAAILEGTDDSALKYAVGHYPGLGDIGKPGNYVLLGHRNYVYGHFFRNLDKLEVGDEVLITKESETYTYVVHESFVVKPEDVWVLEQTEDSIITMITCTPMGTYENRLIVRGTLKDK